MSIDVKKMDILLEVFQKEMTNHIKGTILGIYVIDKMGLIINALSNKSKKKVDENVIGALSSLVRPLIDRLLKELSKEYKGILTFDIEDYKFIFCIVGKKFMFVIVCDPGAILDPIFENINDAGKKISQIIKGENIIPLLPGRFQSDFVEKFSKIIPTRIDNYFSQTKYFVDDLDFVINKKENIERYLNAQDLSASKKLDNIVQIIKIVKKRLKKIKIIK